MNWGQRILSELRRIVGATTAAREERAMREEMRFHLDMHAAKLREQGVGEDESRRRAAVAFGGAQWVEAARDEYRSRPVEEFLRDTRFVARSLVHAPAFTATVLLTLSIGVGAAAAIFTVVNDVVVRSLPYGHPEQLASVSHDLSKLSFRNAGITPNMYFTYRRLARSLRDITIYRTGSINATEPDGAGNPQRLTSAFVTGNFMTLFEVPAAHGRALSEFDDRPGAPNVLVISDDLWRTRFGADPNVVGKQLLAAGSLREIIGVMPPSFRVPAANTQVWLPQQLDPAAPWLGGFNSRAYARLTPGATVAALQRELTAALPRTAELYPLIAPGITTKMLLEQGKPAPTVVWLRDDLVAGVAPVLWILAAAAALVLLVMCANVANLMLVRAESRHRELAVRAAMGASRARIVSHFFTESFVLAGVSSILGLAAAFAAVRILVRASPIEIPRLAEVQVDVATMAFVVAASALVAVACTIAPAVRAFRGAILAGLRDSGRGATTGRSRVRARSVLVGVQMALALVALVASGLLLRSFDRLRAVKPGFDPNSVATLWVAAPPTRYPTAADVARFQAELSARVSALPGVTAAGISTRLPLASSGQNLDPLYVEGAADHSRAIPPLQHYAAADAGYFRAMNIPVIAGRLFDRPETQRWNEAVVSGETAKQMFGDSTGGTVLGRRFQMLPDGPMYTVIGVIGSVRDTSLALPPAMAVYMPTVVTQDTIEGPAGRTIAVVARTIGDVDATTRAIRRVVHELDPTLPTFDVRPMAEIVSASTARLAFIMVVLGAAAGVTLLLGVVGLYGVIAFIVSLRTRELGLRIALGATPRGVAAMVARRGLVLSAMGAVGGTIVAAIVSRFLRAFLFEVTPLDPATLAGAIVVLTACALAASWIPARRAARLDPSRALRSE
jgi:putative ABC transport system permease protein